MKIMRTAATVVLGLACLPASAGEPRELGEVVVTGTRPLKDTGLQKTAIDSTALKENIALSMADVLAYNSSIYVKNHGRATLSTVAFRGTSPGHTQVNWNGLKINSPMLGMTDFSTIPAFFVDRAVIFHGTSSVGETGGGIGGLVNLSTNPDMPEGFNLQYVQGIGSFSTFDEFLRFGYSDGKWTVSTRAMAMSSPNDYKYLNHDKKVPVYDFDHNIIGSEHPVERNRSGAYRDIQVLQEVYYNTMKGDRFGLTAWYTDSDRELPLLTTDYGDERDFENKQREHTFRGVVDWTHSRHTWHTVVKAGYAWSKINYDYRREMTNDVWTVMSRSRSRIHTIFGRGEWEWNPSAKWLFNANISLHQHLVRSEDKNIILQQGDKAVVGYDKGRLELSGAVSAKWRPIERFGVGAVLREELYGQRLSPLIPALFIDGLATRDGRLLLKASVSGNYRFPSLNDLYFLPGGNPDLKNEKGFTYDAGASYHTAIGGWMALDAEATWFDSYINEWIIWLPTAKGFFSPRNVGKVHAYGVELKGNMTLRLPGGWEAVLNGSYSWTPSVNRSEKLSDADKSVGKQLPYVPRHSASVTGRLNWKGWSLLYKWNFYSERYTMSSNDHTLAGRLPAYFMNDVSLEKSFSFKPLDLQLQLAINNLFNEDYVSVLSRPMPGINFEIFIGITPHFLDPKKRAAAAE